MRAGEGQSVSQERLMSGSNKRKIPPAEPTRSARAARLEDASSAVSRHLVSELGWTREQAAQVRAALQVFDQDWNAPGMEEYDKL